MKKLLLTLICLFLSLEVKSFELKLICTVEGENEQVILYINSKYNYLGTLEDFEEEKKETKQTSKMKITEKYIKVITLGETYLDDEMRSQRREDFILLNRLDGKLTLTEWKNYIKTTEFLAKCKKYEKLF